MMSKIKLGQIIWLLLIVQLCWTILIVGKYVIYQSNLSLWLNPDYSQEEKISMLLEPCYMFSRNTKDLPLNASYLMIKPDIGSLWIVNYYFFPRKLYWHEGIITEADIKKLPAGWLKERAIEYAIVFSQTDPDLIKILKIGYLKDEHK